MAAIETRGLTKHYGDVRAIEDVTLEAHPGQVVGFLGPNGAGKSTTIKILVGLVEPTSGRAWIDGHDVQREGVAARERVGYVPEVVGLYERMTARGFLHYTGRFYGFEASPAVRRADELLARVRLHHAADRRVSTFSKGMRQRLALAGALFHDPDVLILDEPLTGLDPEGIVGMKAAIERLGRERTVFLSSHELHAVESLCDRAIVLDEGRVLADAPVDELTRREEPVYRLRLADPEPGPEALETLLADQDARVEGLGGGQHRVRFPDPDAASAGLAAIVDEGLIVRAFERDRRSLEDAFVDITGVRT